MNQHLESAEELTAAMEVRSPVEALAWFSDWLERRDHATDEISNEDLAVALETLAAELRGESREVGDARSSGLDLAASFLTDSASGVRRGDALSDETLTTDRSSTT
jgi:hypothetical protein